MVFTVLVLLYGIMNWDILIFLFLPFFVVYIARVVTITIFTLVIIVAIFIAEVTAVSNTVKYKCHAFE